MSEEDVLAGLDFRTSLRDAQKGAIVKSLLRNYLYDASFPAFDLHFPKQQMERAPDGWFHPSTHPLWTDRQLFHYVSHPEHMEAEKKEYMGTLSVTIGKAIHGFIEMCLTDAGIRPLALQECTMCPPDRQCDEAGVMDQETGSRGHMDGVLDLSDFAVTLGEMVQPVFEFKTTNQMKLAKVKDLDTEAFRAKWPVYYAQVQEYMRLSGRRAAVVFMMALGYPWEMREFHILYDVHFALNVRDKYLRVRDLAETGGSTYSLTCCGKRAGCPARAVCEVGR